MRSERSRPTSPRHCAPKPLKARIRFHSDLKRCSIKCASLLQFDALKLAYNKLTQLTPFPAPARSRKLRRPEDVHSYKAATRLPSLLGLRANSANA